MKVPKSREWYTEILPELDSARYTQMLRVNRSIFSVILNEIKDDPVFHTSSIQFPTSIQIAIVLFRLGSSGESGSIRKMASVFGVGDGETI